MAMRVEHDGTGGGLTAPRTDAPAHPSEVYAGRGRAAVLDVGGDEETIYLAFMARVSDEELQDPTISIPRQLAECRKVLPANAVITAFYWDVETSRKDLAERGNGAHESFDVPVPRDGGIADLLADAERRDRKFDAVVCESADRLARLMHQSLEIEHRLDRVGVPIIAADEGFNLGGRKSTRTLLRRNKQVIAEWYIGNLLEMSWAGYCEHTRQGWNIGVPPHGYLGERVPHPVPAKREQGLAKTRLLPDEAASPAIHHIFTLRVTERLSYQAIADRLNADLDRYPPKRARPANKQRETWSASAVREVLENPKYTGYMVWNRRASKTGNGRVNPPRLWVWSARPTHEPLVTVEMFKAAQAVKPDRERSRTAPGPNLAHPDTKRSYVLRSYVFCAQCDRRMFGNTRRTTPYMACQPSVKKGADRASHLPEHPTSIWVREDALIDGVIGFFGERVLGPDRRELLAVSLARVAKANGGVQRETASLRRAIADCEAKKARLIRQLESHDDADGSLFDLVCARIRELDAQRDQKRARLALLAPEAMDGDGEAALALVDRVVTADADRLRAAPEPVLRTVFDAFRLRVTYDATTGMALCRVVLRPDTLPAANAALQAAVGRYSGRNLPGGDDNPVGDSGMDDTPTGTHASAAPRSHLLGALGRTRTCAHGSGGRCSIR